MFLEQQFPQSARPLNAFYWVQCDGIFVKVYQGSEAEAESEREHVLHWRRAGFKVPRIIEGVSLDFSCPYLVFEDVGDHTLSLSLKKSRNDEHLLMSCFDRLVRVLQERHHLAVCANDIRLIHPDLHPDNILLNVRMILSSLTWGFPE